MLDVNIKNEFIDDFKKDNKNKLWMLEAIDIFENDSWSSSIGIKFEVREDECIVQIPNLTLKVVTVFMRKRANRFLNCLLGPQEIIYLDRIEIKKHELQVKKDLERAGNSNEEVIEVVRCDLINKIVKILPEYTPHCIFGTNKLT